jgi:putative FmdB family regulatory protein
MPLYEFVCKKCGEKFEARQRLSERERRPMCPRCASAERVERVLSRVYTRTDRKS